ncbi:hypothetical protein ACL03H_01740 [Saccharopolyspora sp. MS10]|uniref:hypothetical protein n=1 Tax=Saccharopolyspora sp. MS10 TaxID=3385973 RepID=UPI00399FDE52
MTARRAARCWMTSVLIDRWHLVPLEHGFFRQPADCGVRFGGPVHRRLAHSPPPARARCARCARPHRWSGSLRT